MIAYVIRIAKRFSVHNMMVASAGIAFYGLLALAPTMIALGSIYGLFTCDTQQIEEQLDAFFPDSASQARSTIESLLKDASGATENGCEAVASVDEGSSIGDKATRATSFVLGLVFAFWSASGAVQKLVFTITTAYEAKERRSGWMVRLVVLGFTIALVLAFAILLLLLAVLPLLADELSLGQAGDNIVNLGKYPLLIAMYYFGLSTIYRYGPDLDVQTPWWNWGAVVGTAISVISVGGLTLYSSVVGAIPASYGVIGGFAVLMIALQLLAISALVGAEINAEAEGIPVPQLDDEEGDDTQIPKPGPEDEPATFGFGKTVIGLAVLVLLGRRN